MASFKLHIARIRNCPSPAQVAATLKDFGLPEGEEFGVLDQWATEEGVFASVVHRTEQVLQRLDAESGQMTTAPVEKATVYPFGLRPASETLEIYAGPASAVERLGLFFSGCLALPTIVSAIELDIPSAVRKLMKGAKRFQLRSVRVSDYAHNSYMAGPYAPKFVDTPNGLEFLEEYADSVTAASVRLMGPTGRAGVNLTDTASFSFSCKEDDEPAVQTILRGLIS